MPSTEDEFGTIWHVKPGDPAAQLRNYLNKRGFDIIVLPRYTYMTGQVTEPVFYPGDVVKAARLADCVGVLTVSQNN